MTYWHVESSLRVLESAHSDSFLSTQTSTGSVSFFFSPLSLALLLPSRPPNAPATSRARMLVPSWQKVQVITRVVAGTVIIFYRLIARVCATRVPVTASAKGSVSTCKWHVRRNRRTCSCTHSISKDIVLQEFKFIPKANTKRAIIFNDFHPLSARESRFFLGFFKIPFWSGEFLYLLWYISYRFIILARCLMTRCPQEFTLASSRIML